MSVHSIPTLMSTIEQSTAPPKHMCFSVVYTTECMYIAVGGSKDEIKSNFGGKRKHTGILRCYSVNGRALTLTRKQIGTLKANYKAMFNFDYAGIIYM